jgi:hypothetical protein
MQSASTTKVPVGSDHPEVTWEEIGFAEFPIVTTSLKRYHMDTLEFVEEVGTDDDGRSINRSWKMVGSAQYGLPRLPDLDVFIGILRLLEESGYQNRIVHCTFKDICGIAGLEPGGMTYRRLQEAFIRFATTTYIAERVFRDPKTKVLIPLETWEIITESRFTENSAKLPSYFEAGKRFLSRLQQGQLKPVDLSLWRELPLGLEKPIYHYLDKNLYGNKDRHEIGLKKLSARIALTGKYKPYDLQRLLSKPLSTLVKLSFLDRFSFEPTKSRLDPVKLVVHPGPRARKQRSRTPQVPEDHQEKDRFAEGRITRKSPIQISDGGAEQASGDQPQELLAYFRSRFHRTDAGPASQRELAAAGKFLAQCKGDMENAKSCIRWIQERAGWIENFAGLFFNSYPAQALAFLGKEEANRLEAKQKLELSELRRRYEAWYALEVQKRFDALNPDERATLLTTTLEGLRAGPKGETFKKFPSHIQERLAERRARGHLGNDLPSFDGWLQTKSEAPAT